MTDSQPSPDATNLTVRFVGEIYRPTSDLTFGRVAELVLDDNSYLHRRAGRFRALTYTSCRLRPAARAASI